MRPINSLFPLTFLLLTRLNSYLNNLHPCHHSELYSVLPKLVAFAIPLWDATLHRLTYNAPLVARIEMQDECLDNPYPEPEAPDSEDDQYGPWSYFDDYKPLTQKDLDYHKWHDGCRVVQPDPANFKPLEDRMAERYPEILEGGNGKRPFHLRQEFSKLQIIVKLTNVHLTPDKPKYEGGTWQLEGQPNENMYFLFRVPDAAADRYLVAL